MKKFFTALLSIFLVACHGQNPKNYEIVITNNSTNESKLIVHDYKNSVAIKNKDYKITANIKDCQFEILVDDVPVCNGVAQNKNHGTVAIDISINNVLLKSGKHEILLKLYPIFGKTELGEFCYGDLKLWYWNAENHVDDSIDLLTIRTPQLTGEKNPISSLSYYELKTVSDFVIPYSTDGWTNSINLKDEMEIGNDLKNEIQNTYDKIREIIKKHDTIAFSALIKEREKLLGTAFYSTLQEQTNDLEEFLEIINNPDYEVEPYQQKAKLYFYGYGKLITILTPEKEGIIKLVNKKLDKNITLDFYFHRKKAGEKLSVIL